MVGHPSSLSGRAIALIALALLPLGLAAGPTEPYRLLADINPGTAGGIIEPALAPTLHSTGSLIFFLGDEPDTGVELWRTDGTADGTVLVADLTPGAADSFPITDKTLAVGGLLYFRWDDGVNGQELWKSDGTGGGTFMVADIFPGVDGGGTPFSGSPSEFVDFQGMLHFRGRRFVDVPRRGLAAEVAIWRTDGTEGGTMPLVVAADANSANITRLAAIGNRLYYADIGELSSPDNHGLEPFVSDGTQGGTAEIVDLYPGSFSSSPTGWVDVNGIAFFRATDASAAPDSRLAYFRTDGTAIGTWRITPTSAAVTGRPDRLTAVGSTAYFDWPDGPMGGGLWKSDGAPDDAAQVIDLDPGRDDEAISDLVALGDRLLFIFDDGTSGLEWWTTDGTEMGTEILVDARPGIPSGAAAGFQTVVLNNLFYFATSDSGPGTPPAIWRTDGTPEGTTRYIDLPGLSFVRDMHALGTTLIFAATGADLGVGLELFAIDLVDLVPTAPENPFPENGATVVGTSFALSWDPVAFATSYDVFLWPASGTKPVTPTEAGLISPSYAPPGLVVGTTYQWQVVARGDNGSADGPEWLFRSIRLSQAVQDFLIRTRTLTPEEQEMADVNDDGKINIADLISLINMGL